jgi:hypothetical protein
MEKEISRHPLLEMPYEVKHKGAGRYAVVNKKTGKEYGLTTKAKAEAQMRLLYGMEGGMKPRRS